MQEEYKEELMSLLNELTKVNIVDVASSVYKDRNLTDVEVSDFILVDVINLFNKAIPSFKAELVVNWRLLPEKYSKPNKASTPAVTVYPIKEDFVHVLDGIVNKSDFSDWITYFIDIVNYERQNGFWDKYESAVYNPDNIKLGEIKNGLELMIADLNNRLIEVYELKKELYNSIADINDFAEGKKKEYSIISANQDASNKYLSVIRDNETESAVSNSKISGMLSQIDRMLEDSKKKISQDRKVYSGLVQDIEGSKILFENNLNNLVDQNKTFDGIIQSADDKEKYILDKKEEIDKLVGFAADGTLGGVFNKRSGDLKLPIFGWGVIAIMSVLAAVWWITHIFTSSPSVIGNSVNWFVLIANTIRTSPAFILVYFCLSQYAKERNIQEEYAFKAAVSMTVTAYSEMIGVGPDRTNLLINTIQGIYTPPSLGKEIKPLQFNTKDLADTSKNVTEAAKTLKETVVDVVKNIGGNKDQDV